MSRGLRVLHVLGGRAFAGTERHALDLTMELRRLGCDAELACPGAARELQRAAQAARIPVHSLSRIAGVGRSDIVHVHDGRAALIGRALVGLTGAGFVRTQHFVRPASAERAGLMGWASAALHRTLNRRLNGYVCVSQAAARAARTRGDARRAPMAVIPPGIRLPGPSEAEHAAGIRRLSSHPVIISAGRLESERRFDVLLEALPSVLHTFPDCEVVIAGAGSAEASLRLRARELGVGAAVGWPGWVSDLAPVLAAGHVYVNTWPMEGFGMATAEAMGSGLPVIAVNTGASPELVADGVTGRLVAPLDPAELASVICELLRDREALAAMGGAGRQRALERYSIRSAAESMLDLYRKVPRGSREH